MTFLEEMQQITESGKKRKEERQLERREHLIKWVKKEIKKTAEMGKNKIRIDGSEEDTIILFDFFTEEGFGVIKNCQRTLTVVW